MKSQDSEDFKPSFFPALMSIGHWESNLPRPGHKKVPRSTGPGGAPFYAPVGAPLYAPVGAPFCAPVGAPFWDPGAPFYALVGAPFYAPVGAPF